MKIKHPDVTAILDAPGYAHNVQIHGHPHAGTTYLRNGIPVAEVLLGDPLEGTAYGNASTPKFTAMSLAELDELIVAAQHARERLALWAEREAVQAGNETLLAAARLTASLSAGAL